MNNRQVCYEASVLQSQPDSCHWLSIEVGGVLTLYNQSILVSVITITYKPHLGHAPNVLMHNKDNVIEIDN